MTTPRHPMWLIRACWRSGTVGLLMLLVLGGCGRSPEPPATPAGLANAELSRQIETARSEVLSNRTSGAAWGRLGQCFEAAEFFPEARICYAQAEALDTGSARWPHLLGLLLLQESPEDALVQLARAVAVAEPTNDFSRVRLVQALVERGRFAEATNHLAVLLTNQATHPAARLELARVRLAEGRATEAIDLLTPCLTNPYTARPAVLLLSQCRVRVGDAPAAAALASKAATMPRPFNWPDPYSREVQNLRQDLARQVERVNSLVIQRRFDQAEELLKPLIERSSDHPEVLLVLGRVRLQQGRCDEAEAAISRHLEATPSSLNGLIQLGLALMCQSRWTDAGKVFGRAVELKPDFAQAHFNLGMARIRTGDTAGAIASLREALRCSPGDARAHSVLADALASSGQTEEAAFHRERARSLK